MKTNHCREHSAPDGDQASPPPSRWRRGGELAGWVIPTATLIVMPKCPICMAAYVALVSGVGISFASASKLRPSLLIICSVILLALALKLLCRLTSNKNPR
jgi:hypothetical protein